MIALFGMTVTGLFNVAGTLLFGTTDLGGPSGLFYFYSYFVIFLVLGAYFWPLFVAHTLVRPMRAPARAPRPPRLDRPPHASALGCARPKRARAPTRPTSFERVCTGCFTRAWCSPPFF